MPRVAITILSLLTLATMVSSPIWAQSFAPRALAPLSGSMAMSGSTNPFVLVNQKKKHKENGFSTGIGISIDIGDALKSATKKKPEKKPARRKSIVKKQDSSRKRTAKTPRPDPEVPLPGTKPGVGGGGDLASSPRPNSASGTTTRCPENFNVLLSDSDYLRDKASFAEREAAMMRDWAKRWREISKQAADGAKAAGEGGLISSREFQEQKAAELEERAQDYEARAAEKENEAAEYRRQADEQDAAVTRVVEDRCRTRQDGPSPTTATPAPIEVAMTPGTMGNPASAPEQQSICGPDITDNVFGVLDRMHRDWMKWSEDKRTENCRSLISPLTALSAWDIVELAPGKGFPTRDEYKVERGSDEGYERYIKWAKFRFEEQAPMCGKPREQCANTVTFLGKCIDPQIVNYVQWGSMSTLCDYSALTASAHSARATIQGTPDEVYTGQQAMAEIGSGYTLDTNTSKYFDKPSTYLSADPGAWPAELQGRRNKIRDQLRARLDTILASPKYAAFLRHSANTCAVPCPISADSKKKIDDMKFDYKWNNY